jgi:hypothetical protein
MTGLQPFAKGKSTRYTLGDNDSMIACWEMTMENMCLFVCVLNQCGFFQLPWVFLATAILCSLGASRENGLGSGVSNIEKPKGMASVTTSVPN